MTEENEVAEKSTVEPATPNNNKPPRKQKRGSLRRLWRLVLLIIVIVILGWLGWRGWLYYQHDQQQTANTIQQLNQQLQQQQTSQQQLRQQLQTRINSLQAQVKLHRNKLAKLGNGGSRLWLLNEAKSLASLAQQRLILTADLSASYQLLQASSKVLSRINDPNVLPARKALAGDMQQIQAAQQIDTTALLLKLGALVNQLPKLSLPGAADASGNATNAPAQQTEPQQADDTSWWHDLWQKLPITVQRTNGPLPLPLAPAQLAQARLSLGMDLQQAQLAVLQGRAKAYQQALAQASTLLTTYFSNTDSHVRAMQDAVAQLKQASIHQALPQIGAGLEAINALLYQASQQPTQGS